MSRTAPRTWADRRGHDPVALVWTEVDGSVSHVHPCQAELVSEIRECPQFVRTGCTRTVAIWRCAGHGSVIAVVTGDGKPHRCAVGASL